MREERRVCTVLVVKPKGKKPLRRLRHRWEDRNKMDLGEIGWEGLALICLAQNSDQWWALVNMVIKPLVLVPQG
jgi:hypothetical protein